jgi:2-hydroxychromene-2-carboxylate isomerase
MTVPLKSKWSAFDMPMWAKHYGVPFNRNPFFPVNTLALMRGAAAAQIDGIFERYHPAIYKAMWIDGINLNDIGEVAKVLAAAGLDAARIGNRIQDQDVKDRLKATTDEAVARGVFGAPTSFVGDMMFFGNDRLPFVEMALKGDLP